jgi:hypothetical protein
MCMLHPPPPWSTEARPCHQIAQQLLQLLQRCSTLCGAPGMAQQGAGGVVLWQRRWLPSRNTGSFNIYRRGLVALCACV